jgi:hypothetical protein
MSLAVATLLLTACGGSPSVPSSAGPSGTAGGATGTPASPSGPPVLGIDWGRARSVERPEEAFASPTASTGLPAPSDDTVRSGHPLHFPGQAIMSDVASTPGGRLVSVGYVYPGWHPTGWVSDDAGATWSLRDMGTTEFTFPVSLAATAQQGLVAVGRTGSSPLAWTSPDGNGWTAHAVPVLGDGTVAERMTTVLATQDGFLAGGSAGPELFERHARFWRSPDGRTWTPAPDDSAVFADAEVRAITRLGDEYVAVGVVGSAQRITGSTAWTSADGDHWSRVDAPDLARGRAIAVIAAPAGGLVAVGSDLDEHEALAWTSQDGRAWQLAPSEPSRQYHGKVRFTDVTVAGDELVGVGNYVGLQRGTAISWVSTDGRIWRQARSAPVQEQGEFYAVTPAGAGIVAVGSFGAPDDYIPTVWLSPAR